MAYNKQLADFLDKNGLISVNLNTVLVRKQLIEYLQEFIELDIKEPYGIKEQEKAKELLTLLQKK